MTKGSLQIDNVINGTGASFTYDYEFDPQFITEEKFQSKMKAIGKKVSIDKKDSLIKIGYSTRYRQNQKNYRFTTRTSETKDYYLDQETGIIYANKVIVNNTFPFPSNWYKV